MCLSPANLLAWVSRHEIQVRVKTHMGGCQLSGRSLLALSAAHSSLDMGPGGVPGFACWRLVVLDLLLAGLYC